MVDVPVITSAILKKADSKIVQGLTLAMSVWQLRTLSTLIIAV
jgi:hypothetical protein